MRRLIIIITVMLCAATGYAQKPSDTIKVYFDLAVPSLNTTAMSYLDSLGYYNILPVNKKYGIVGYADYLGTEESNVVLSEKRAASVQEYLQGLGIKPEQIETVIGKGEVNRELSGNEGYPTDRRVDIIIGGFKEKPKPQPKPVAPPKPQPAPKVVIETPPPTVKNIDISKVEKNETIRLDKIFFLPGSHKIREESVEPLFNLYTTMKYNPSLKIKIEGHICCLTNTNTDGYDYDEREYGLSKNRAKAVYEYLISKNIDSNRMSYEGFGITNPLKWPERSLADENMNRRVEIRIIDK